MSGKQNSIPSWKVKFNPLCTGRLFHCYTLGESIFHFNGVGSILFILFLDKKNNVDPDQTPQYVASDLDLHCLPLTLLRFFQVRMSESSCNITILFNSFV